VSEDGYTGTSTVSLGADLGYRAVIDSTPYTAQANFTGYDEMFAIEAAEESDNAFIAGLSLMGFSDIFSAKLGLGAEVADEFTAYTVNAAVKVRF
jgi:hypothetical protein